MAKQIKLEKASIAQLREAQRELHDLLPEFDKMESCGIDCQEFRAVAADAQQQVEQMLKHYGGPQPQ